jgi:hypothetical protein
LRTPRPSPIDSHTAPNKKGDIVSPFLLGARLAPGACPVDQGFFLAAGTGVSTEMDSASV